MKLSGHDLIDAAYNGDIQTVRCCLKQGVSVECRTDNGFTALQWACLRGVVTDDHVDIVRLLLDAGSDPNSVQFEDGDSVLVTACDAGNSSIVRLLIEAGANVNAMACGTYPLISAVETGDADTVEVLLNHGADKQARDATGSTALDRAIIHDRPEIIRILRPN